MGAFDSNSFFLSWSTKACILLACSILKNLNKIKGVFAYLFSSFTMVGIVVHLDGCIIHLLVFLLQQRCTAEDVALWPHFLDFRGNILIEPQPKTCKRDDSKVMILSFTEAF